MTPTPSEPIMTTHTDEELIAIAKAATPGEWFSTESPSCFSVKADAARTHKGDGLIASFAKPETETRRPAENSRFAATFNPAFVLSLLERAQAAEARARTAEEAMKAAEEKREEERKYEGVARFVDSETIAELMEAGARTWAPISEAKPERNGSLIIMTGDAVPIIGQAFWHEVDGVWRLYWSAIAPSVDCWNDPIDETNHGVLAFMPMPEAPCDVRVAAIRATLIAKKGSDQ